MGASERRLYPITYLIPMNTTMYPQWAGYHKPLTQSEALFQLSIVFLVPLAVTMAAMSALQGCIHLFSNLCRRKAVAAPPEPEPTFEDQVESEITLLDEDIQTLKKELTTLAEGLLAFNTELSNLKAEFAAVKVAANESQDLALRAAKMAQSALSTDLKNSTETCRMAMQNDINRIMAWLGAGPYITSSSALNPMMYQRPPVTAEDLRAIAIKQGCAEAKMRADIERMFPTHPDPVADLKRRILYAYSQNDKSVKAN